MSVTTFTPPLQKELMKLRIGSRDATPEQAEGDDVEKSFEAMCNWLEKQRPGQFEVFIGRWFFVGSGGVSFKWDGKRFSKVPPTLLYPIQEETGLSLESDKVQGVMRYEAWKLIKMHHDFFYKGISGLAKLAVCKENGE